MSEKPYFNASLITDPKLRTNALGETADIQPPPVIQTPPQIVPVPVPVEKPRMKNVSVEVARRAQMIYPREAQKKQDMIDNAKAPPSATGAWGTPQ